MERYIIKDGKRLRSGYTTGLCAAAAAKAAAWMLLTGRCKSRIAIDTPKGVRIDLEVVDIVMSEDAVSCAVVKDGGDDPDVTTGAHITATVRRTEAPDVLIDGGDGVGRVTKPGLDRPVGDAAINTVPREMIREGVTEVIRALDAPGGMSVVISVPGGDAIARKTFNPRMGVVGGISIIGTTGIVEPMSEAALVDTIRLELRMRRAAGARIALLAPGNYGADLIRDGLKLDPGTAVMTSNFIGDALEACRELGFEGVLLVGHVGKLVKLAGGMFNTHSKYGDCRMEILSAHAGACGLAPGVMRELLGCATCDDAIRILKRESLDHLTLSAVTQRIGENVDRKAAPLRTGTIVFSKVYGILGQTPGAAALLGQLREG